MSGIVECCEGLEQRDLAAGELLLEEGAISDEALYILREGSMEVLKGDVPIAVVSEPGSFLGETSLLLSLPYSATVRALEPSAVWVAPRGCDFLESSTVVALSVARLLAKRLHLASSYLADMKRQYEGADASLEMMDVVLGALVHHQEPDDGSEPGSERDPNY